jgi:starvation-inducible DNA-binding protein
MATTVYRTRLDLDANVRGRMIDMLNQQLADSFDLLSQTKQAHWNVKGPEFWQLHELFDKLAEGLEDDVDLIAERVTALGGEAMGTVRMAAQHSRLPEYPTGRMGSLEHVSALAERFGNYAASTRAGIDTAAQAGDQSTADLLTEISRQVDKYLWFLEAHLQD